MAYTAEKNIISTLIILFVLFSFIFCCYLWCAVPLRRRHAEISIEPMENGGEGGGVGNGGDEASLSQITIDIAEEYKYSVLLLGDSILANEKYVPKGKSVFDFLKAVYGDGDEVFLFARDNYTIHDVYFQISNLPISYNSKNTSIVLSVGGNNFLTGTTLGVAKKEYIFLIERIRENFGECKLYLVNLYLPFDPLLQNLYEKIVVEWNSFLEGVVRDGLAYGLVDISRVITEPEDLVSKIEPSAIGGEKIAGAIVNVVKPFSSL
jgi:hypothetical protein